MQSTPMKKRQPVPITQKEAYENIRLIDEAILNFTGNMHHLETAIGMFYVGRQIGWKPLLLIHDKKTIKRSEEILGVKFREIFDDHTINSDKSIAWNLVQTASSFWKAVSGEIKGIRTNRAE